MRINKFLAQYTSLSRRAADAAIVAGRVTINGRTATLGDEVTESSHVALDGRAITPIVKTTTIMLNKPVGYVVSRNGQGSKTIYDLLPPEYHHLNPVGRLDKDSSGLLLLTNDGQLANDLTHPSRQKTKIYEVTLDKPLTPEDKSKIEHGIQLEDGISSLQVTVDSRQQKAVNCQPSTVTLIITMHEGRNRQIRRTFAALGYEVKTLHRTHFGPYSLGSLSHGAFTL